MNTYYVRFLESVEREQLCFSHPSEDSDYLSACHLRDLGLLDQSTTVRDGKPVTVFSLSVVGRDTLARIRSRLAQKALSELFDDVHAEEAKKERQQRFDNKIAIANVLIPFVCFVLGLVVEHRINLLSLLAQLFH